MPLRAFARSLVSKPTLGSLAAIIAGATISVGGYSEAREQVATVPADAMPEPNSNCPPRPEQQYRGTSLRAAWGDFLQRDPSNGPLGAQLLRRAADKGYPPAEVTLAVDFFSGKDGFPKSDALAFEWAHKAYLQGNPDGEAMYGVLLASHQTGGPAYVPPPGVVGVGRIDQAGLRILRHSVERCSALGLNFLSGVYVAVGRYEDAYTLIKAGRLGGDPEAAKSQNFAQAAQHLTPQQIASADEAATNYKSASYMDLRAGFVIAQSVSPENERNTAAAGGSTQFRGTASLARAERMYGGVGEDTSHPPAGASADITARVRAHASIPSNETLISLFRIVFRKAGEFIANSPSGNLAQNMLNNSPGQTGSADPGMTNIIGGFINAFGGGAVVKAAGNRFVQWADTAAVSIRSRQLYEENWVVYVNVRPAGQDGVDVEKMVVTKQGDEWVASLPQLRALLP